MDKVILVIGEVTRNQYQDARMEILRDAHVPKLLRVTMDELWISDLELERLYGDRDRLNELLLQESEEDFAQSGSNPLHAYYMELAYKHVMSFGCVRAVVSDARSWCNHHTAIADMLQEKRALVPCWIVDDNGLSRRLS